MYVCVYVCMYVCMYLVAGPPPVNVTALALNSTSIIVSWVAPPNHTIPGTLEGYVVRYSGRGLQHVEVDVDRYVHLFLYSFPIRS